MLRTENTSGPDHDSRRQLDAETGVTLVHVAQRWVRPPASWASLVLCCGLIACGGKSEPEFPDLPPQREEAPDDDWDTGESNSQYESLASKKKKKAKPRVVEEDSEKVPTKCSSQPGSVCVPAGKWVRRLCADVYPGVALFMFQSGTPWQRMYLTRETDAVNASGGATIGGTLEFDEEVLVLRHRGAGDDDIQIGSGGGSYDALRWNGSCVSLEGEELTSRHPPKAKASPIDWRYIGDDMESALRKDSTVNDTYIARKRECKGATMGAVSKKCEVLDKKLSAVTVEFVRGASNLPQPKEQP